ncbi:MAG: phosphoribosylglycinamide formyltransferase [Micavibrio sp.]|nr:MAG: phosphoribosylglycinamide formyltransferase [Micavibrio sp.]
MENSTTKKPKIRAAIFASGKGTNAENLIRHAKDNPDFEIAAVICDQEGAGVIGRCVALGIPCHVVPFEKNRAQHEAAILETLSPHDAEWIFLAGYMRILSPEFLAKFYDDGLGVNRIVNIHPSLLPWFKGRDAYRRAYESRVAESGVTVHFVDEGIDSGPIILQWDFPRQTADTLETFTARGMELEYKAYIKAVARILEKIDVQRKKEKYA